MAHSSSVRQVIDQVRAEPSVVSRLDGSVHEVFPVAASLEEGEELRRLVTAERAERCVEIGLGYGISALFICEALVELGAERASHTVIDPYQESRFANVGLQLLEQAGVGEMVTHVPAQSQVALPRFVEAGVTFDFAFVDGNHRFDWFFVDLFFLGRLLRPGSVVVADDYQLPGVAKAVSYFLVNRGWIMESHSQPDDLHQWAVLRTSSEIDRRPFTAFSEF